MWLFLLSNDSFCCTVLNASENGFFFSHLGQIYLGYINQGVNLKVRSFFSLVSTTGRPRLPASFSGGVIYLVKYSCQDSEGTGSAQLAAL